jgi:hypothetical protein
MEQEVILVKEIYGTATYRNVVNTQFSQLITPAAPEEDPVTVEKFFNDYETLFYQIPIEGEFNSHEYLVKRSSEYIGGGVITDNERALIEEINSLRQQLLEANKNLLDFSKLGV